MMLQDESLKRVLLVSSSKEGDLINYADGDSRFMFNFGDGAAAAVLERDLGRNVILESAMIVDGRFATDVSVPGVGCCNREDVYKRQLPGSGRQAGHRKGRQPGLRGLPARPGAGPLSRCV